MTTQPNTLVVGPTRSDQPYYNVNQMLHDYQHGKPVLVSGYGPLSGLAIDCYEEQSLKDLGYNAIEFRLGAASLEVAI